VLATMQDRPGSERAAPTRTCVGCGLREDAAAMVRLVVAEDEVAFDLAGGSFGRGAHVHARPDCLAKAPRGLARAFKREVRLDAVELAGRLTLACERRMTGLLLAARRAGSLAIGADAARSALRRGAPLVVVAVDAGTIAQSSEVSRAVTDGCAVAWKTKTELGTLLGEEAVAICAVTDPGIASELKDARAAADAAATTTREGAECSSRRPEAR
jgi:predicted RNA-binding protein YlxR (DUF448 family)/ribosomal protein L7Ae-like RNA K-turn-binding protein